MPNHKTHDIIGVSSAITSGLLLFFYHTPVSALGLSAGLISGTLWLSPDLDLNSRIYRRWGLLRFYWLPYKNMVAHRSIYSHSGIFSATLRLLYLFLPVLICFCLFLPNSRQFIADFYQNNQEFLIFAYFGVVLADYLHCFADWITEKD